MPYKVKKKGNQHCVVVSSGPKAGKEIACHDDRKDAVAQVRALYANDAAKADQASVGELFPCVEEACDRKFLTIGPMFEHAEAVHTFDDVRQLVSEAVRESYGRKGDYRANPPIPSVFAWIADLAEDWVVFTVESDNDITLYKASYSITDGVVSLGQATEVRRRTVYEPVTESTS